MQHISLIFESFCSNFFLFIQSIALKTIKFSLSKLFSVFGLIYAKVAHSTHCFYNYAIINQLLHNYVCNVSKQFMQYMQLCIIIQEKTENEWSQTEFSMFWLAKAATPWFVRKIFVLIGFRIMKFSIPNQQNCRLWLNLHFWFQLSVRYEEIFGAQLFNCSVEYQRSTPFAQTFYIFVYSKENLQQPLDFFSYFFFSILNILRVSWMNWFSKEPHTIYK